MTSALPLSIVLKFQHINVKTNFIYEEETMLVSCNMDLFMKNLVRSAFEKQAKM